MSYCRFQNTLGDLYDCKEALEELDQDPDIARLSEDELRAAKALLQTCADIINLIALRAGLDEADLEFEIESVMDDLNAPDREDRASALLADLKVQS
jgi:hypothetical protein